MEPKNPRRDGGILAWLQRIKDPLIPLQIIAVVAVSAYLLASGSRSDPVYVPLLAALPLIVIAIAVIALELILFRTLEIRSAQGEGRKYVLLDISWRNAQKAFAIAIVVAVLLLVPPVKSLTLNVLSPAAQRSLGAGGTFPLDFYSQDALGISHAQNLQVVVQSGTLGVDIVEGGGPPIVSDVLAAGQQRSFPLAPASFLAYTVTFRNLANATTTFAYKVNLGLPTGFINLAALLMGIVAFSNLAWLVYMKPLRAAAIKAMPPAARRARARHPRQPRSRRVWQPGHPAYARRPVAWRWPWQPAQPPQYPAPRRWNPAYAPYQVFPARPPLPTQRPPQPPIHPAPQPTPAPTEAKPRRKEREEELPPPPAQVDPYEVEGSPPPLVEEAEDADRAGLRQVGTDISGLLDKAEDRVALGELQEALEDYETVLSLDPRHLPALLKKAELLRRVRRPADAMETLDRVLELDPWHQRALLARADLLEEQDRYDAALECYDAILRGGPAVLMALVRKGDVMARLGEAELAWEAYSEAQRLAPEDAELGEKIRAIEAGHGGTLDPESPGFLEKKARAAARAGKLEEALEICEAAVEEATEDAALWALKGALEEDLGRQGPAIASLRKATELNPEDQDSAKRLEGLQRKAENQIGLERTLREIEGLSPEVIAAITQEFKSLETLKRVQVKTLMAIEGVKEDDAKAILRRIRSGR